MADKKPEGPVPIDDLNDTSSVLSLLKSRRSAGFGALGEPGPSDKQINELLEIAVRVPDHGKLAPWRFILFEGDARQRAGEILEKRFRQLNPGCDERTIIKQGKMLELAPVVIAVVSTLIEHEKIPAIEQQLSAGAVCQNLLLASTAMGFGCQWLSGWMAYDREFLELIGVEDNENIAGFIYIGKLKKTMPDRPRPDVATKLTRWGPGE